jgi:hypothetical protein
MVRTSSLAVAALLVARLAFADTHSYTGTLASPEDSSTQITVVLDTGGPLYLQTWGFGGGTNAADQVIPAGGFDPFVGVFAGTGDSAVFIDGTSDLLSNYTPGCPPAGTVNIGGEVCGDVSLTESLAAGTYTVLLTDGGYIPAAVFESSPGYLGDGFFDFTGGVFQTCNTVGQTTTCVNDTANWALDISTPVPEPNGLWLAGFALIAWGAATRLRPGALRNPNPNS